MWLPLACWLSGNTNVPGFNQPNQGQCQLDAKPIHKYPWRLIVPPGVQLVLPELGSARWLSCRRLSVYFRIKCYRGHLYDALSYWLFLTALASQAAFKRTRCVVHLSPGQDIIAYTIVEVTILRDRGGHRKPSRWHTRKSIGFGPPSFINTNFVA
ncbi:hypothetical protein GQ53DRAFT_138702 [Thozetella sp. PMI_491]|nr:hypothetical protein GQ53DRAFT_138702 [Thozetella sp. PMI_491]